MRILQINVTCRKGSTGKIAWDLCTAYNQQGHTAVVCYGRDDAGVSAPEAIRIAQNNEVRMHALKTRVTGDVGHGSSRATARLLTYLESFQPDVVHLHNIHGYYVDAYRLLEYLKVEKLPTVLTMHDEWIFTGKCGYSYDCERWQTGCGQCPQLRVYPKSLLLDRSRQEFNKKRELFDGFDRLILAPVANWLGEKAASSPILGGHQFCTVYNGIDLSVFHPSDDGRLRQHHGLEERSVLLHVTPNFDDPRKGGRYVLELAQRMEKDGVVVIIIGLRDRAITLPSNVIALSRTEDQAELAQYYAMANLFLLTSEMECLPTVALESVCCGTPVVGFDRGGAREAAPDGYGHFVSFGDIDRLENVVRAILNGQEPLATPEGCIQYGRSQYARERMSERYLELYHSLLTM